RSDAGGAATDDDDVEVRVLFTHGAASVPPQRASPAVGFFGRYRFPCFATERIRMFMLRRYSCVEMTIVLLVSFQGEVSLSSPTCGLPKSPAATVLLPGPRYGWLFCGKGAGQ